MLGGDHNDSSVACFFFSPTPWLDKSEHVFSNNVNSQGPEDGSVFESVLLFGRESQFLF